MEIKINTKHISREIQITPIQTNTNSSSFLSLAAETLTKKDVTHQLSCQHVQLSKEGVHGVLGGGAFPGAPPHPPPLHRHRLCAE